MQIEGIPDGWELVSIGRVKRGEFRLSNVGQPIEWEDSQESGSVNYVVIRKIEKPKRYRPFANAAEFEPHRDKWLLHHLSGGAFRTCEYNDNSFMLRDGVFCTFEQAFKEGRKFYDGTPFGVEVIDD